MNNLTFGDESVGMLLGVKIRNSFEGMARLMPTELVVFDAIG
jgi:hypothetical protein